MILELSKDLIAKVKAAETAKEAGDSLEQGKAAMIQLFEDYAFAPVAQILALQRCLRCKPVERIVSSSRSIGRAVKTIQMKVRKAQSNITVSKSGSATTLLSKAPDDEDEPVEYASKRHRQEDNTKDRAFSFSLSVRTYPNALTFPFAHSHP
jgi:hypothetical protein